MKSYWKFSAHIVGSLKVFGLHFEALSFLWTLISHVIIHNVYVRSGRCYLRHVSHLCKSLIFLRFSIYKESSWQADICQLGMDQRKVNVLAREYCDDIKRKNKPIILSHRGSWLHCPADYPFFSCNFSWFNFYLQTCFQAYSKDKKRCQRVIHHLPYSWKTRRFQNISLT